MEADQTGEKPFYQVPVVALRLAAYEQSLREAARAARSALNVVRIFNAEAAGSLWAESVKLEQMADDWKVLDHD